MVTLLKHTIGCCARCATCTIRSGSFTETSKLATFWLARLQVSSVHCVVVSHTLTTAPSLFNDPRCLPDPPEIKITDFGGAKEVKDRNSLGRSFAQGSPYWMAPEVIQETLHTFKVRATLLESTVLIMR